MLCLGVLHWQSYLLPEIPDYLLTNFFPRLFSKMAADLVSQAAGNPANKIAALCVFG
jgi:hypothetical protein